MNKKAIKELAHELNDLEKMCERCLSQNDFCNCPCCELAAQCKEISHEIVRQSNLA